MRVNLIKPCYFILLAFLLPAAILCASDDEPKGEYDFVNEGYKVKVLGSPELHHDLLVYHAQFLPGGQQIVSASLDRTIRVWNAKNGREIRFKTFKDFETVVFSQKGLMGRIEFDNKSSSIEIWDLGKFKRIALIQEKNRSLSDVISLALLPKGEKILLGFFGGTLKIWDLQKKKFTQQFKDEITPIRVLTVSPDGKFAAYSNGDDPLPPGVPAENRNIPGLDATIRILSLESGKTTHRLKGHKGSINAIVFSPDGKTVLSASDDHTLWLWDLKSGKEIRKFTGHNTGVSVVAFSPNGKTAVSGGRDDYSFTLDENAPDPDFSLKLWDVKSGEEIRSFSGHQDTVSTISFSPDGKKILSGGNDYSIRIWNVTSGKEIHPRKSHFSYLEKLAFTAKGRKLIAGYSDNSIRIWSTSSYKLVRHLTGTWTHYAFSQDGSTLLVSEYDANKEKSFFRRIDVESGKKIRSFAEKESGVLVNMVLSPKGKKLLTADMDGNLSLYDVKKGTLINSFKLVKGSLQDSTMELSLDSKYALITDPLKIGCSIVDMIKSSTQSNEIRELRHRKNIFHSVTYSRDGQSILSAGRVGYKNFGAVDKYAVILWDVKTGKKIHILKGHIHDVYSVDFFPGNSMALSGGQDRTVRLWGLGTGKALKSIHNRVFKKEDTAGTIIYDIAVSHDGQQFATANANGTICLYQK